jgi:nucleosome assembly protein 1-like 1
MPDEKELENKDEDMDDEEEKDVGELMDADFDIGNEFKDQLIPLALEYYFEVIQEDDDSCEGCEDDECCAHDKDSDEDAQPK